MSIFFYTVRTNKVKMLQYLNEKVEAETKKLDLCSHCVHIAQKQRITRLLQSFQNYKTVQYKFLTILYIISNKGTFTRTGG